VDGLNLIITGGNGSGKTSFVKAVYDKLRYFIVDRGDERADQIAATRNYWNRELNSSELNTRNFNQATKELSNIEIAISEKKALPQFEFKDLNKIRVEIESGKGVVEMFEAYRQANIAEVRSASSIEYNHAELRQETSSANIGSKLEGHLVNLHTRRVFALNDNKNAELYASITKWFEKFRENLRVLLEDEFADIVFDADKFKFFISQKNKPLYTFQTLSSGYSSIFAILARLLMRSEYLRISPSELSGVVIIDEIDAHLHVSLQKKILPFLCSNFPGLQFVVTTHSPFVLSSVSDAVIYDLTTSEQVEDLSSYSYSAVLQAVFGVVSSSDLLDQRISELSDIVDSLDPDFDRLSELVGLVGSDHNRMDEESKFFVNKAIYLLKNHNTSVRKNV
jgi:AAA15 family ATPase/GTPase